MISSEIGESSCTYRQSNDKLLMYAELVYCSRFVVVFPLFYCAYMLYLRGSLKQTIIISDSREDLIAPLTK